MAKKKHLIRTSAVLVALGESTPSHCTAFRGVVAGGNQDTSVYIRKEFLRRWICYYIRMAFEVDQCGSLEHAMQRLNQAFRYSQRQGAQSRNHRVVAREDADIELSGHGERAGAARRRGTQEVRSGVSEQNDKRQRLQIGGKPLSVDFNHLFDDLRAFMASVGIVNDCPVNGFLTKKARG